ncbi:MAG: glutamine synthetase family protein [Geminicoccaceae bacterium]|nr:glutamine synthetase family protein [Geminicoccaceae bacterium]
MLESGFGFASSLYGMDSTGTNVESSGLIWEEGDADRPVALDLETLAPMPWQDGGAQVIGGLLDHDGSPFFANPRTLVQRLEGRLGERGLHAVVAFELEFYLYDPAAPAPAPTTGQVYGLEALQPFSAFLETLERFAEAQELPIKGVVSEYAPGQLEVNLGHRPDALQAADHALLLKRAVKAAARAVGLAATFMALPFDGSSTSGMHVHLSLVDDAGANRFAAEPVLLRHALGGLQATMAEAMLLFAPNPNSFRRLRPKSYAPTSPCWGQNNRTVALRIPASADAARRIEHRTAGADASPYLVLAGILAGILHGIEHQLEPDNAVVGNGYDRPATLPLSLEHALDAFEGAAILPPLLDDRFCRLYLACRRAERDRFNDQVTPLERAWYLEAV